MHLPVHVTLPVRRTAPHAIVIGSLIVSSESVDVACPEALVGQMTRTEARRFCEAVLSALDQTRSEEETGESADAKDAYVARLSHKLRTPLTPILAAVGALRAHPELPVSVRNAVDVIDRNVVAEARLIDALVDDLRIRERRLVLDRRRFSLHELLAQLVDDARREASRRGVTIDAKLEARADVVDADRDRMAQALRTAIAIVTGSCPPQGRMVIRTVDALWRVRVAIEVEESCEPREAGTVPRPSDPRHGLDLGAAVACGIVEAHGGRIELRSSGDPAGAGVAIELDAMRGEAAFDASREGAAVRPDPVSPAIRTPGAARVLLVEDHPDSAESLALVLRTSGYAVRVVGTVAEARESAADCDLIISDIALPDGTGYELLRSLGASRKMGAIAVSGYGTEQDVRATLAAGFDVHLVKPVEASVLHATIEQFLGARHDSGAEREAPAAARPAGRRRRPAERSGAAGRSESPPRGVERL